MQNQQDSWASYRWGLGAEGFTLLLGRLPAGTEALISDIWSQICPQGAVLSFDAAQEHLAQCAGPAILFTNRDAVVPVDGFTENAFAVFCLDEDGFTCSILLAGQLRTIARGNFLSMDDPQVEAVIRCLLSALVGGDLRISRVYKEEDNLASCLLWGIHTGLDGLDLAPAEQSHGEPISPSRFTLEDRAIPILDFEYAFEGANPMDMLVHFEMPKNPLLVNTLRDVVQESLQFFTLFSAKLVVADGRYYLMYSGASPLVTLREECFWNPDVFNLADMGRYMRRVRSVPGESLFHVTLTPTQSGILFGVSLSHIVADGSALVHFIKSVMSVVMGQPALASSHLRSFQRCGKMLTQYSESADQSHPSLMEVPRYYQDFCLDNDSLEALLREHGSALLAPRHAVLSAYVLKHYLGYFYRGTAQVRLRTACDLRDRFPSIKRNYLGNAFIDVVVSFDYVHLLAMTIGEVAEQIDEQMRVALSQQAVMQGFRMTAQGVVPCNPDGALGLGFNPDTDLVGSSIAGVTGGALTRAAQLMKPKVLGPFFTAHKGFLMYEREGVTHIALISDRPFASDPDRSAQHSQVADADPDELLLAY